MFVHINGQGQVCLHIQEGCDSRGDALAMHSGRLHLHHSSGRPIAEHASHKPMHHTMDRMSKLGKGGMLNHSHFRCDAKGIYHGKL